METANWFVRDEQDASNILEEVIDAIQEIDEKIIDLLLECGTEGEKAANSDGALDLSFKIEKTVYLVGLVRDFITRP